MNLSKHLIPTTTDPRHLILNLRILGFTELCRTQPLVYSSPLLRTTAIDLSESAASSDEAMNEGEDGSNKVGEGHDYATSNPHDATGNETRDDPHVIKMIRQAQKLYVLLEQIHNPVEKDLYVQELINVGALLAYPHPENSPLARYLSMERREAVAEQINKAILGTFDFTDFYTSRLMCHCSVPSSDRPITDFKGRGCYKIYHNPLDLG